MRQKIFGIRLLLMIGALFIVVVATMMFLVAIPPAGESTVFGEVKVKPTPGATSKKKLSNYQAIKQAKEEPEENSFRYKVKIKKENPLLALYQEEKKPVVITKQPRSKKVPKKSPQEQPGFMNAQNTDLAAEKKFFEAVFRATQQVQAGKALSIMLKEAIPELSLEPGTILKGIPTLAGDRIEIRVTAGIVADEVRKLDLVCFDKEDCIEGLYHDDLEISASQAGASSACYKLQEILATQGGKLSTTAQGEELAPGHELAYGQHTLYYKAAGQAGVHDIKLAISTHKGDVKTVTTSFKLIEATFDSSASLKQVPRGGNEVLEAIIKVGAANLAEDPWQLASWQVAGAVGKLQSASGEELSAPGVKLQPGENRFVLAVSEREALTDVPQLKLSIEQPDGVTKPATLDLSEQVFQGIKTQVSVLQEALKTALSKAIAGERFGQERLNRIISQLAVFRGNLAVLTGATALNRDQVEEVLVAVEELMQAGQTTFALELQVAKPVAFLGEEIKLLLTLRAAQEGAHAATYKLQMISSTPGGQFKATGQGEELPAGYELAQGVNALYYNPGSQAGVHEIRLVVSDGSGYSCRSDSYAFSDR